MVTNAEKKRIKAEIKKQKAELRKLDKRKKWISNLSKDTKVSLIWALALGLGIIAGIISSILSV